MVKRRETRVTDYFKELGFKPGKNEEDIIKKLKSLVGENQASELFAWIKKEVLETSKTNIFILSRMNLLINQWHSLMSMIHRIHDTFVKIY